MKGYKQISKHQSSMSSFQVYVFHVLHHPEHQWYTQCVTFGSFPSPSWEKAYTVFGMVMTYFMPLIVIVITYAVILFTIHKKSTDRETGIFYFGFDRVNIINIMIIMIIKILIVTI